MKKTLLFALVLVTTGIKAQVTLPYYTGFDNQQEQNGWTQFRLGFDNQFQEWAFDNMTSFSPSTSLIHYYPVGGADTLDDWFVSPAFDASSGAILDSIRYHFSGFGVPNDQVDKVYLYQLTESQDPLLASTVDELYRFDAANYQNDATWRLLSDIALPELSANSYFAIRYRTVNNWLDVRFDNIAISGASGASVFEKASNETFLFPNPSNGSFAVKTNGSQKNVLILTDLTGRTVLETVTDGSSIDGSHLPESYYMYRIISHENGTETTGKLVIVR